MARISRRTFIASGATAGALAFDSGAEPGSVRAGATFRFALNAATLRGYKLSLAEQIDLTAQAGYGGIEPWVADIGQAAQSGTPLADLRKRCADAGLAVVSAIGFAPWAVDDETARAKGLEQMKRDMDLVAQLGGSHIAAAPAGVNQAGVVLDLDAAAARYRAVLELGRSMGVIPQLEFWGASANLARLDQCLYVAAAAGDPNACILADIYHMYRGGSDFAALRMLSRNALHCLHMNDYPARPPRGELKDADRVWPGDGIAPFPEIMRTLRQNRVDAWLSIELFNAAYWRNPALETARAGLAKMRAVAL